MNPQTQFCHNLDCPARGKVGQGTIRIFSKKQQRYDCKLCGKTFSATKGTPFYRLRTAVDVVTLVLTLLVHGCPTQAIVAAFGFDERTVADWQFRAGSHAQQVHEHIIEQGQVDLPHVQADELWVKLVGQRVWMAMAMAVPSRLWVGGVVSPKRDKALITALVQQVRRSALSTAILVCVDGLASYASAFPAAFRHAVRTGRCGRPRLVLAAGFQLAQVVKHSAKHHVTSVTQRVAHGTSAGVRAVLVATHTGTNDHHGVYRAAECHLPQPAELSDTARAGNCAHTGAGEWWDVAGGRQLQLLYVSCIAAGMRAERGDQEVEGADASDGGGSE